MSQTSPETTSELSIFRAPGTWKLRAVHDGKERYQVLRQGHRLVLGTGPAADWTLSDNTVSARHCVLEAQADGLLVRDLGSKNGTFVGAGKVEQALLVGPRVRFSLGCTTVEAEQRRAADDGSSLGLLGQSDSMTRIREQICLFAPLKKPVLILGESGTGKDVVAQALHNLSGRQGKYVAFNTAAMPDTLLDAELFGHRRGAFTGAEQQRVGLFEEAQAGTLFLDEIADMSLSGQAKLLRVVEDGKVRALGASESRSVQVRLVAATCADLKDRIRRERFRHDLYHRLSMLTVELPPLRARKSDIFLLAAHYLKKIEDEVGAKHLAPAALSSLCEYDWPGNVRELFGALYRAAVHSPGEEIEAGHLAKVKESAFRPKMDWKEARALLDVHPSLSAAARAAGMPRSTFRALLERGGSK